MSRTVTVTMRGVYMRGARPMGALKRAAMVARCVVLRGMVRVMRAVAKEVKE
jgi:hypothetical protein